MDTVRAHHLTVFPATHPASAGGNPTTIFLGADGLSDAQMQALVAENHGHECGFVLQGGERAEHDFTMRYYVPTHEMEMCGHATVGAVWAMAKLGMLGGREKLVIGTRSGDVEALVFGAGEKDFSIRVSQPVGVVEGLGTEDVDAILGSLGLRAEDLKEGWKVQNGRTSRTKTLVPVRDREVLDSIAPVQEAVRGVCERIGSTGLYPYAVLDEGRQLVEARQFPKFSGYLEDPATGIAAAALTFGLLDNGFVSAASAKPVLVRQGWSMGKPSEIQVYLRNDEGTLEGCWISGNVQWAE